MKTWRSLTFSAVLVSASLGLVAVSSVSAQETMAGSQGDHSFESLDTNHDGSLTRSEIPEDMSLLRTRMATYDANQNGMLDAQEFAAAKAALEDKSHPAGGAPNNARSHPPGG